MNIDRNRLLEFLRFCTYSKCDILQFLGEDSKLCLKASNRFKTIAIQTSFDINISLNFLINITRFYSIINSLNNNIVSILVTDSHIVIKDSYSIFNIPIIPINDLFFDTIEIDESVEIMGFNEAINSVSYCNNNELFLSFNNGFLDLISIGGSRRISKNSIKYDRDLDNITICVDDSFINILQYFNGIIKFKMLEKSIIVALNHIVIQSSLLTNIMPKLNKIHELECINIIKVDRVSLLNAVRKYLLVTSNSDYFSVLKLHLLGKKLNISIVGDDTTSIYTSIPVDIVQGSLDFSFEVNPSYVFDALENINSFYVNIEYNGSKNPIIIRDEFLFYSVIAQKN